MTFCKPCRFILAFCLLSAAGSAAAYEPASTASSGDGLYHVTMGAQGEIPLVAINGGPGLDHTYLANAQVWKDMSVRLPIIIYDQLGTAKSPPGTRPTVLPVDATVLDSKALLP